jgi:hypothetical protein
MSLESIYARMKHTATQEEKDAFTEKYPDMDMEKVEQFEQMMGYVVEEEE